VFDDGVSDDVGPGEAVEVGAVVRLPNTDRSCRALLNLPKWRANTQLVGLFWWLRMAHFHVSR
jgi:hypothetical protein